MLVQDILIKSAELFKDEIFIQESTGILTFRELDLLSDKLANKLIQIKSRSTIGIYLKNSIEYFICYFAIIKAGHIAVALNPLNKGPLLRDIIFDSQIKAIFITSDDLEDIEAIQNNKDFNIFVCDKNIKKDNLTNNFFYLYTILNEEKKLNAPNIFLSEQDIALIIYTSGTTGIPKGVCLSHLNLTANMFSIIERIQIKNEDNMLVILPLYFAYGNSLILSHLYNGATLTLNLNSLFPNNIIDDIEKWNCTSLAGVASNFIMLLKRSNLRNRNLSSLRYISFAGEPISDWIIEEFKKIIPKLDIYIMYGQTEATARLTILTPDELILKKDSVGKAIVEVEINIIDNEGCILPPDTFGEIIAKGPNIMNAYWNSPEETALKIKNNTLFTGDMGKLDKDGYLYINGRKDEMMKIGGEKVFPLEIERIIMRHPDVLEVAVIGHKKTELVSIDSYIGLYILAFIKVQNGITKEILHKFCKTQLPYYKIPKDFIIIERLPKTSSGKLKRQELLELIQKK